MTVTERVSRRAREAPVPTVRRVPFLALTTVLAVLTMASVVVSVAFGAEDIALSEVWRTVAGRFTGGPVDAGYDVIIWDLRLPRSILAAIVGAGLALAGALMQALVRNPLAEPYLLGVSAGAAVGATAVITLGMFAALGIWALSGGCHCRQASQ